jgi:malolactic enzyme
MCANTERPVIFPISNPTKKLEATAEQVIEWSDGKAFVATGVPSGTVHYQGVDYEIGQANNALIYPGLGLGMLASEASLLTDEMIGAAAHSLSGMVDLKQQVRLFSHHSNMWQMFQSKSLKLSLKWHKNKV